MSDKLVCISEPEKRSKWLLIIIATIGAVPMLFRLWADMAEDAMAELERRRTPLEKPER